MTIISIIIPAATRQLVSLATVRAVLGWTTDEVSDELAGLWIDQTSAAIETVTGRTYPIERVTEELHGGPRIVLDRFPLTAVHSVKDADGVELDADAWRVADLAAGVLCVPCRRMLTIEYSAGFATIPADLQGLVLEALSGMRSRQGQTPGLRSETLGDYRYEISAEALTSAGGLSEPLRAALESWRDVRLT